MQAAVDAHREPLDPPSWGLVLDSGVLIVAERSAIPVNEPQQSGLVIPFADLPIGTTALHFGHAVETRNLRHFQMIPGLRVVPLRYGFEVAIYASPLPCPEAFLTSLLRRHRVLDMLSGGFVSLQRRDL